MDNCQLPFATDVIADQAVVVVGAIVGTLAINLSAWKVPVLGAGAPLIGTVPVELTTVLVKFAVELSPLPPLSRPIKLIV